MRKIVLRAALEFGGRADFEIIDVTEKPEGQKRGTITIDYAPSDILQLKEQGMDFDAALEYYRTRIYGLIKYYLSGDWECVEGFDKALEIVESHIKDAF
ncbi:MAG: hypothetical protein ACOX4R_06720 [Lentihominibacter sp.]|jgi:hypothetical protein